MRILRAYMRRENLVGIKSKVVLQSCCFARDQKIFAIIIALCVRVLSVPMYPSTLENSNILHRLYRL